MNETYEWLYDHYALPLMRVEESADEIKRMILSHSDPSAKFVTRDQLENLCLLWGTESFAIGLQLGLRLMSGQRAEDPIFL